MVKIKINGGEVEYTRPHLKQWLVLQDLQVEFVKAVEHRNDVAKHIVFYVSTALNLTGIDNLPWYEIAIAYLSIVQENALRYEFPFLNTKIKDKKEIWDYNGRTWYVWGHLFAKEYGWRLEDIEKLDVDDAFALAQEIAVEEQLDKEWEWITVVGPHVSSDTFKPLERPMWMKYSKDQPVIPKLKIRKDFMPSGVIYRWNQDIEPSGSIEPV